MSNLVPFPSPLIEAVDLVEAAAEGILVATWPAIDRAGKGAIAQQLRADVSQACARAREAGRVEA